MTYYLTSYFHGAYGCKRFDTKEARSVIARHLLRHGWTHLDGETKHKHFGFLDLSH